MDKQPEHSTEHRRRVSKPSRKPGDAIPPAHSEPADSLSDALSRGDASSKLPGVFGAVSRKRLSSLVQTFIVGALQGLQELVLEADAAVQAACKRQIQSLQGALRFVHKTFPAEDAPEKVVSAGRER